MYLHVDPYVDSLCTTRFNMTSRQRLPGYGPSVVGDSESPHHGTTPCRFNRTSTFSSHFP